jgi:hypothetical protein
VQIGRRGTWERNALTVLNMSVQSCCAGASLNGPGTSSECRSSRRESPARDLRVRTRDHQLIKRPQRLAPRCEAD